MKRNRLYIAIAIFFLFASPLRAQVEISLEDAIRIAQDSTIVSFRNRNKVLKELWDFKYYQASRKPQVSLVLSPNYRKYWNDPTSSYYNLKDLNLLSTEAQIRMEQNVLGFGGSFYASTSTMWTEFFNDGNGRIFTTSPVSLGYYNELIGYNPFKWEKAINEFHLESAKKNFLYQIRIIAKQTAEYYLDYLIASSNYSIREENARVSKQIYEIGQQKYKIAAISKNELLALELQVMNAENSLYNSSRVKIVARSNLLSYLQMEDNGEEIRTEIPKTPPVLDISLEQAKALAIANQPSYRNAQEDVISAEQKLRKAKVQSGLQMAVDLNLGIQGHNTGFGDSYRSMSQYTLGIVSFSIPIIDHGLAKSRKRSAEYNLARARDDRAEAERLLELEVSTTLLRFNIQQDLIIRTNNTLELADESFDLVQELYRNGNTDINTFVLAQNRRDDAYKNYLDALKDYWESYYSLSAICLYDFINGRSFDIDSVIPEI